ncbi:hypothetical protein VW35_15430 [Devosia soli]|uniref:HTH tetR-type domain-containing protein n=1 Tax=Devosia soli TaxID=361041 RepID=A0A0F5L400_9HYPH|nr:TetR/AcrR family transcriptional regulator [Devosia soli]KKB77121.1 hypothetical protein VW35_15430 [Devosia soli]
MSNSARPEKPAINGQRVRRPRADAAENREAILAAARDLFETEGVLAPLDAVAVKAGVGNATLYRHFPKRDDLLAAVIQSSSDDALIVGQKLSEAHGPGQALAEWVVDLAWRLRIWHDLPHCIASAHGDPSSSLDGSCRPLINETGRLLAAAQAAKQAAPGIGAEEVYELVLALSWAVDRYGDTEERARHRVLMGTAGVFLPFADEKPPSPEPPGRRQASVRRAG